MEAIYKTVELGSVKHTEILGVGTSAAVKLAHSLNDSSIKYSIKIYEKYKLLEPRRKKRVLREISILSKLHHPNIVKIIGSYQN